MKNGIGYSEHSGARFIDMAAVTTVDEQSKAKLTPLIPEDVLSTLPWALWGANNLLPIEMGIDIESCGILNSIIDLKMRFGICNGVVPVKTVFDKSTGQRVIDEYVDDAEINDFLEGNNFNYQAQGWMRDMPGYANAVGRYGLNKKKDPKIVVVQRDDVNEFRYEKKNKSGVIANIYLHPEWNRARGISDSRMVTVPLIHCVNPAYDLAKKVNGSNKREFAFTFKYPGWNRHYYSMPLWYAALKWVKIAQGVPEMKAAIFENSIHVKYVVIIHEGYWLKAVGPDWKKFTKDQQLAKKKEVWEDIDKFLVGSKNAYKSIFATGYRDKDGKVFAEIEIKPVEDTQREGQLLPDSAAANSEIAFAMHFNNSILGGNQKDGPYQGDKGGSSVREAGLMQVVIMEPERHNVKRVLDVPKKFNKWDVRIPGLEFMIPATSLTTLDTGAGSKPVVTGNTKVKEDATS